MNSQGISFFCVFISLVLSSAKLYAQDTIVLETIECAVVKFHLNDDCPCSYFTLETRNGQTENEHFILICIDSVILIHVADNFIGKDYLINDIRYLFLSDTIELLGDTTYIASVGLQYDMNYVVLVELYDENDVYLEIPNGRLGDFARRLGPEQSRAGFDNWGRIKNSINECNTKYGFKMNSYYNSSE